MAAKKSKPPASKAKAEPRDGKQQKLSDVVKQPPAKARAAPPSSSKRPDLGPNKEPVSEVEQLRQAWSGPRA